METSEKLAQAADHQREDQVPTSGRSLLEVCLQGHGMGHCLRGVRRRRDWNGKMNKVCGTCAGARMRHGSEGMNDDKR